MTILFFKFRGIQRYIYINRYSIKLFDVDIERIRDQSSTQVLFFSTPNLF